MPLVRRRRVSKMKKPMYRRKRQYGALARPVRRYAGSSRTFTETLDGGVIFANSLGVGGIFQADITSIPQWESQAQLYQQQSIKKLKVTLVPKFSGTDLNQFIANIQNVPTGYSGFSLPKITQAIEDSPALTAPTSQLDVLQMNGARVVNVSGTRNITMSCRPTPNIQVGNQTLGGFAEYRVKKRQWFSFPNPGWPGGANLDPNNVVHFGIPQWAECVASPTPLTIGICQVILSVTFSVRDPK